jgi:hypothetical protein
MLEAALGRVQGARWRLLQFSLGPEKQAVLALWRGCAVGTAAWRMWAPQGSLHSGPLVAWGVGVERLPGQAWAA